MKDLSIFKGVSVSPSNAELFVFLANYAKSKGVPVYVGTSKNSYINGYTHLSFTSNQFSGNSEPNTRRLSVEEFIALCDEWANDRVKLNDEYTATIDRKNQIVHVGCQEFTFESISNLHRKICNSIHI